MSDDKILAKKISIESFHFQVISSAHDWLGKEKMRSQRRSRKTSQERIQKKKDEKRARKDKLRYMKL